MQNKIQFILIIGLMVYSIWLQQCRGAGKANSNQEQHPDTTIVLDTQMPAPIIVQMPRQAPPAPYIIYIDSTKQIVPTAQVDPSQHDRAQVYQDSIEDDNLTLYYKSMVQGELLDYELDYQLKIPKKITKTVTITKPIPQPAHSLFFNTGVGVDLQGFSSVTVGMQFMSNKGWALGYHYDVLQNRHEVKLGIRLWRQKKY
ncbi:hypothetical protein [Aureispira anguillae]|nr:hypothetical protein [Aureispira anguillae]